MNTPELVVLSVMGFFSVVALLVQILRPSVVERRKRATREAEKEILRTLQHDSDDYVQRALIQHRELLSPEFLEMINHYLNTKAEEKMMREQSEAARLRKERDDLNKTITTERMKNATLQSFIDGEFALLFERHKLTMLPTKFEDEGDE